MEFTEILDTYRIPYAIGGQHRNVRYGWIGFDHQCGMGTGKFHAAYHTGTKKAVCWQCGPLRLIDTLQEITGLSYPEVKALVGELPNYAHKSLQDAPRGRLKLPNGLGPLLPCHKAYINARGFNPDELTRLWGIQGIGLHPRLAWRIFIPVIQHGKTVSWTTRSIVDEGVRYVNAKPEDEAVPIKNVLYGADYVRHAAILVEGPTDVWAIGPGAVCTFGLSITAEQINLFSQYPIRYVCFDNETDAQRKAHKVCQQLRIFPGTTQNVILDAKDPGSADKKEIAQLRKLLD